MGIDKYGDQICYSKLAKELGRDAGTIRRKILNLKKGTVSNGKHTLFTLEEDYCIIDCALSGAKENVNLRELDVNKFKSKFLAEQFQRNDRTVYKRWEYTLKHWI